MKTRYAKPFEGVQVKIPYETGMDPYSGLVDLFEKQGILTQQGNRLKFVNARNEEILNYRKDWTGENLQLVMDDFSKIRHKYEEAETPEEGEEAETTTNEEKTSDGNE
jgi:2-keto-3-deoxy-galactonokinase